ncbi:MAG: hypothetical protein RL134_626 [Actinomycetota bacterium]|jgi:hypothetical protein
MALTYADKALLDFAGRWYRFPGAQEQAMRDELGLSATAYWRRVSVLIDQPDALAYAPTTVARLRRMRDERLQARSARGLLA